MRIFILFLLMTSISISSSSDKHKDYTTPKKVIIAGKVDHRDKDIKYINVSLNRPGFDNYSKNAIIDSSGNFQTFIECYIPSDIWISYKTNFLIVVHPGDSIFLTFNGNIQNRPELLETVTFSGDNVKSNEEVAQIQKMYYTTTSFRELDKKARTNIDFRDSLFLDSVEIACNNLYKQVIKEVRPGKEVKQWAYTFIFGQYIDRISVSNDSLLKRIPTKIDEFYCGSELRTLVNKFENYTYYKSKEDSINKAYPTSFSGAEEINKALRRMDSILAYKPIRYMPIGILQQAVITRTFERKLKEKNITFFETYRNVVDSFVTEPFLHEPLVGLYNQLKEELNSPENVTANILSKLKGTEVASKMDEIFKENNGKVIYIDCWGTWCAPCKSEMLNSKALSKELVDKKVEFVYICFTSNYNEWQKMVNLIEPGGKHYFLSQNESDELSEILDIKSYPNYVLIDKKGIIVDRGSHLRPNETKQKILELEKENEL